MWHYNRKHGGFRKMTRTEQEQNMLCNIKFDVRHHFMYGFYRNASINKLNKMPVAFWQE